MSDRIPPGFAEIWNQINQASDPEPMFTAIGVELDSGVTASVVAADHMLAPFASALGARISADFTLRPGYVVFGNDGGDIRVDSSLDPIAATGSANGQTVNTAVLVRKLTNSGGRRNRGRMYIPGNPESEWSAAGNMTAAIRANWQTALDTFRSTLLGTSEVLSTVLFHETAPFTPTPVTSLEVQIKAATQRRRMRP